MSSGPRENYTVPNKKFANGAPNKSIKNSVCTDDTEQFNVELTLQLVRQVWLVYCRRTQKGTSKTINRQPEVQRTHTRTPTCITQNTH